MSIENDNKNSRGDDGEVIKQTDPPIIVGGGGSAYVWLRKDIYPKLVDKPDDIKNKPANPSKYHVFECAVDIQNLTVLDGNGNQYPHNNVDKDKHFTGFDK